MAGLNRRTFLFGAAAIVGIGGLTVWFKKNEIMRFGLLKIQNSALDLTAAPLQENQCILTSSQTEGPYFIQSPNRSLITDDRNGKALKIQLQILRMPSCEPIENATVEIWHCDANGNYSGHPEGLSEDLFGTLKYAGTGKDRVPPMNEKRYLRGAQQTDQNGLLEFETIFPGWYQPRTPHIHAKVLIGNDELLTTQFYFDHAFSSRVYQKYEPYQSRGLSLFKPENDVVLNEHPQAHGLLLHPVWHENAPLTVNAQIGIQKSV